MHHSSSTLTLTQVAGIAHLGEAGTNYLLGRLHMLAAFGDITPRLWDDAVSKATAFERGRLQHRCGDIGEDQREIEVLPDEAPITLPTPAPAPTPAPEPVPA